MNAITHNDSTTKPSNAKPDNQFPPLPSHKKIPLKTSVFMFSVLGTILEYFEYATYGFLAPVLARHFFPNTDPTVSLIKAFGVFAVGSLSKPIGAFIFGWLGDIRGRRVSLRYSMIGISIPTLIVGILPGYAVWGWAAAGLLILCRMFQGMFIAGESDGVQVYVFEHFGHKYPCLTSNLVNCGAYIGIALGSLVASQVPAQGQSWRLVFLGCSLCGIIVFILRQYLVETPPFLAYQKEKGQPLPIKRILQTHWVPVLKTIMVCGATGGSYHFYLVFQSTYLSQILNLDTHGSTSLSCFWLICIYIITLPLAGWAADRWGLVRMARTGGVITGGLVLMNIVMIMKQVIFFPLLVLTTLSMVFFFAPGYIFLTQQYDVGVRFRCLSIGHTLGSMIFSGTTPVICLILWQKTGLAYAPYIYFLCLTVMGLAAYFWKSDHTSR
jgi:MHS family proline/betaine transporter-like MFS transporter